MEHLGFDAILFSLLPHFPYDEISQLLGFCHEAAALRIRQNYSEDNCDYIQSITFSYFPPKLSSYLLKVDSIAQQRPIRRKQWRGSHFISAIGNEGAYLELRIEESKEICNDEPLKIHRVSFTSLPTSDAHGASIHGSFPEEM